MTKYLNRRKKEQREAERQRRREARRKERSSKRCIWGKPGVNGIIYARTPGSSIAQAHIGHEQCDWVENVIDLMSEDLALTSNVTYDESFNLGLSFIF